MLKPLAVEIDDLDKYIRKPADWVISEKIDGMRFRYEPKDQTLWSTRGNRIMAPDWFTKGWPINGYPLEGEICHRNLREPFETVSSYARKLRPVESEWHQLQALIFDAIYPPSTPFIERYLYINSFAHPAKVPYTQCTTLSDIRTLFTDVINRGGEGLCLHKFGNTMRNRRSAQFIKIKPTYTLIATVTGHQEGRGRLVNMCGALICDSDKGEIIVGSGLDDRQRANPPAIGTRVVVAYRGLTKNGKPRFPTFKRVAEHLKLMQEPIDD